MPAIPPPAAAGADTRSIMQQILHDAKGLKGGFSKLHPYLRLGIGGLGAAAGLSALPSAANSLKDLFNVGGYKRPEDDASTFHQQIRDLSVYNGKRQQDMDMVRQAFMPKTASYRALVSLMEKKAAPKLKMAPKKPMSKPAAKPAAQKPTMKEQAPAVKQKAVAQQKAKPAAPAAAPAAPAAPAAAPAAGGGGLMSPDWKGMPMAAKLGLGAAGVHYALGQAKDFQRGGSPANNTAAELGQASAKTPLISNEDTEFDRELTRFNAARMLASQRLQSLRGGMVAPNPYGATAGY